MPAFYIQYKYPTIQYKLSRTVKQPIRADLNIEPHCETANQSRAQHWAALWNSQSEQSSTLRSTVKQPIRAELNIEQHCETANQSRAQHWAALWNSQSEQSSTLSSTVKQPIRAELKIEPHCETANQGRAQNHFWRIFACTWATYLLCRYQRTILNIVSMHSMAPLKNHLFLTFL